MPCLRVRSQAWRLADTPVELSRSGNGSPERCGPFGDGKESASPGAADQPTEDRHFVGVPVSPLPPGVVLLLPGARPPGDVARVPGVVPGVKVPPAGVVVLPPPGVVVLPPGATLPPLPPELPPPLLEELLRLLPRVSQPARATTNNIATIRDHLNVMLPSTEFKGMNESRTGSDPVHGDYLFAPPGFPAPPAAPERFSTTLTWLRICGPLDPLAVPAVPAVPPG